MWPILRLLTLCITSMDYHESFDNSSIESVRRACQTHGLLFKLLLTNCLYYMLSSKVIGTFIGGVEVSIIAGQHRSTYDYLKKTMQMIFLTCLPANTRICFKRPYAYPNRIANYLKIMRSK